MNVLICFDLQTTEMLREKGFLTGKKGKQTSNLSSYIRDLVIKDQSKEKQIDLAMSTIEKNILEKEAERHELEVSLENLKTKKMELGIIKKRTDKKKNTLKILDMKEEEYDFLFMTKREWLNSSNQIGLSNMRYKNYNENFNKEITRVQFIKLLEKIE